MQIPKELLKPRKVKLSKVIVRKSKVHGTGVFAAKNLKKGERIIEYVGDIVTKKQSDKVAEEQLEKSANHTKDGGVYIFELNKRYDINGNVSWNSAKYINHSCEPNCETEGDDWHIWITALRDIKKGEELGYDYCYDIDNWQEHPCRCGSKSCVGFIIDEKLRGKVRKQLKENN